MVLDLTGQGKNLGENPLNNVCSQGWVCPGSQTSQDGSFAGRIVDGTMACPLDVRDGPAQRTSLLEQIQDLIIDGVDLFSDGFKLCFHRHLLHVIIHPLPQVSVKREEPLW